MSARARPFGERRDSTHRPNRDRERPVRRIPPSARRNSLRRNPALSPAGPKGLLRSDRKWMIRLGMSIGLHPTPFVNAVVER